MTKREKLIDRNVGLRLARLSVLPYAKMITEQQAIEEAKYYADNGGDLDYWNRQIEIEMESSEAEIRNDGRSGADKKQMTYFKGDRAIYTGNERDVYGVHWYEIEMIEGHMKGQTKLVRVRIK